MDSTSSTSETIDFNSYIPYYVQLRELLRRKMNALVWKTGERIPSEPELCREYKVSRTVVRQALQELEMEGYIIRRKGRGAFIAGPKISEALAQKLTGFYQDMRERGHTPTTRVLQHRVLPAGEQQAAVLNLAPETPVLDIRRLRFVDGEPMAVVTSYIPLALCPALESVDLTDRSLYEYLETECRLTISRSRRAFEAAAAGDADAALLSIQPGDPVIRIESISYLDDGTPVEYYIAHHRGDRARFEIDLVRVRDKWRAFEWDPAGEVLSSR